MCETQLLNVGGKAAMRAEISRKQEIMTTQTCR